MDCAEAIEEKRPAFEEEVQISVGRRGHGANALERSEGTGNLLCDGAWRFAQPPGELEGEWRSQVAEVTIRWVFERDGRQRRLIQGIERRKHARDVRAHAVVDR